MSRLSLPVKLSLGLFVLLSSACSEDGSELEGAGASEFRGLEDDLELHWSFEDRVGNQITDLSGNGRHGTLTGGAFVSSPLGEAVSLDGVDDYVALTHLGLRAPSLYGGVSGDFTISARVKVSNVNKFNTLCFGCGPFQAAYVGAANYPGKLLTALFNQSTNGTLWSVSTTTLTNDEWREVTLVVDGGVSARYYLDCTLDGQLNNANIGLKDYNFSSVGQGSSVDRWYGGEIDQLRVWSRALPEAELAELCTDPPPPDPGSPKLHWTFEDHTGNQITDVSGNGYHGTLSGGAFVSSPSGEAVSLDGVNDSISFTGPRSPALYGGVSGDFTISARVRVADLNKYNTLCYGCGPSSTWYLGDAVHGGRMTAAFFNQSTNGTLWTASTPALVEDAWTEVTMVVDGGTSVRHYFDCAFDSQHSSANIGLKDFGSSSVGFSGNAARWFGGEIDELRIWDRALPEQEVQGLCDPCAKPILVDVDAPDGGDGKTWATAFNTLQAALDAGLACNSPQIWVAEGTYAPNPSAPVATISAPVSIYGGFVGTETSLAQRDFDTHPVRLGGPAWQSRVVIIEPAAVEAGGDVRLDGFTISDSDAGAIVVGGWADDSTVLIPTVHFHNLVLTNNSADQGGGILVNDSLGLEIVSSHFEGNSAVTEGAAIRNRLSSVYIDDSTFIANQSAGAAIHDYNVDLADWSVLAISNSVLSGNLGGAMFGNDVRATATEFSNNTAVRGAAIFAETRGLVAEQCTFSGNQADYGGAIYLNDIEGDSEQLEAFNSNFNGNTAKSGGAIYFEDDFADANPMPLMLLENSEFLNNATTTAGGGAIYFEGSQATINDTSFVGNSATTGGGAIFFLAGLVNIDGASFIDNSAQYGGGVQLNGIVTIRNSRFVSNEALGSTGGGLRTISTQNVSVINSEFVGNSSTTHGGGVYGRATFINSTFANNLAGGSGKALFAPAGASMTIRNVVAWPDNLVAGSMVLDHSCIPTVAQAHTNNGTVFIAASPFAPADLDVDGLTEYYLAPSSVCVDLGATVSEFEWSTTTTQASQCTDSTPVDAGVHYTPLSAAGPC